MMIVLNFGGLAGMARFSGGSRQPHNLTHNKPGTVGPATKKCFSQRITNRPRAQP